MKLYELAYACRLYQGQFDDTYRGMRKDLGDDPNMDSPKRLLQFLNKWGCRISKEHLGTLEKHLEEWARRWIGDLPPSSKDILSLESNALVKLVDEYYWTRITNRHEVPGRDQLNEWLGWESGSVAPTAAQ